MIVSNLKNVFKQELPKKIKKKSMKNYLFLREITFSDNWNVDLADYIKQTCFFIHFIPLYNYFLVSKFEYQITVYEFTSQDVISSLSSRNSTTRLNWRSKQFSQIKNLLRGGNNGGFCYTPHPAFQYKLERAWRSQIWKFTKNWESF